MNIAEVRDRAKKLGIIAGKLKKGELIQRIQKSEGNTPCFGTGTPACPYMNCCWRHDCIA